MENTLKISSIFANYSRNIRMLFFLFAIFRQCLSNGKYAFNGEKTAIDRRIKTACICDLVTETMDFLRYTDNIIG